MMGVQQRVTKAGLTLTEGEDGDGNVFGPLDITVGQLPGRRSLPLHHTAVVLSAVLWPQPEDFQQEGVVALFGDL